MFLSELTLPMPYDECKGFALVYSYDTAVQLYETQAAYGDPRHVAVGLPLSDGRWMMYGEILSAVGEGGILAWAGEFMTQEIAQQIEVVPIADAVALLLPPTLHP